MFAFLDERGNREKTYLAGHHFDKSGVLVWPVIEKHLDGHEGAVYFDFDFTITKPTCIAIFTLATDKIQANGDVGRTVPPARTLTGQPPI